MLKAKAPMPPCLSRVSLIVTAVWHSLTILLVSVSVVVWKKGFNELRRKVTVCGEVRPAQLFCCSPVLLCSLLCPIFACTLRSLLDNVLDRRLTTHSLLV